MTASVPLPSSRSNSSIVERPAKPVVWHFALIRSTTKCSGGGSGGALAPVAFDALQVERNLQRHNDVRHVPAPRRFD
jgi:hypothetical protein